MDESVLEVSQEIFSPTRQGGACRSTAFYVGFNNY
jgi:hypothetical protein